MIIKTLAELAEPDEASLLIRPLDIDPSNVAEGVSDYRQKLIADFELLPSVPETTRNSYERVRTIYSYGIFSYDLYTVAGSQARLVIEQALRDRFLPFYDGTVTFLDGADVEHTISAADYDDLYHPGRSLVKKNWRRLKLRSGRAPIPFNGMLTSLLRWAREEGLLGGQRDRSQDRYRVTFRNYVAHPHYHRGLPDDATSEIYHLCNLVNRLWGAPSGAPIRREPMAIAWTGTGIMYGLTDRFEVRDRMPADTPCAIVLADPSDRTIGMGFDTQYEMTAHPFDYLWGPGPWPDAVTWLESERPYGDEVPREDRMFLVQYHEKRLFMPRSLNIAAGLSEDERPGEWYLVRADYPQDAFGHMRQVVVNSPEHDPVGFCNACPVESITSGDWQQALDHCDSMGVDITPKYVPDIRAPLCRILRWNDLTTDGQWVFPLE